MINKKWADILYKCLSSFLQCGERTPIQTWARSYWVFHPTCLPLFPVRDPEKPDNCRLPWPPLPAMDSGSVLIDFGQLDTNLSGRGNFTEKLSSSDWPVGEPMRVLIHDQYGRTLPTVGGAIPGQLTLGSRTQVCAEEPQWSGYLAVSHSEWIGKMKLTLFYFRCLFVF